MQLFLCAVYDSQSSFWSPPFSVRSLGEARRTFSEAANDKANQVGKYPDAFTLFHIGYYDDQAGTVTPLPAQETLGLAVSYVQPV